LTNPDPVGESRSGRRIWISRQFLIRSANPDQVGKSGSGRRIWIQSENDPDLIEKSRSGRQIQIQSGNPDPVNEFSWRIRMQSANQDFIIEYTVDLIGESGSDQNNPDPVVISGSDQKVRIQSANLDPEGVDIYLHRGYSHTGFGIKVSVVLR
jgi:hypothetical protein